MTDRQACVRNFAIIAHIDHGKSTLADRLLELTGTVAKRDMREQLLDSNPIERERGITIKLAPVRMVYKYHHVTSKGFLDTQGKMSNVKCQMSNIHSRNQIDAKQQFNNITIKQFTDQQYILNLIDTPGHVDFSYEVSRSLAACEGAILVVDATQGVQAQTLAHLAQARQHGLAIIPLINKIDLPNARIEETARELAALGFPPPGMDVAMEGSHPSMGRMRSFCTPILISAKTGENVEQVLEAIVEHIPPPHGEPDKPLRALVFSSQYDPHKGVVVYVRVMDGNIHQRIANKNNEYTNKNSLNDSYIRTNSLFVDKRLRFLASGAEVTPLEIGYFEPQMRPCDALRTGEVGYLATGLKDIMLAKIGDTLTLKSIKGINVSKVSKVKTFTSSDTSDTSDTSILPLPGYQEPKPMVFLSLFPLNAADYLAARQAMERLRLSDSAFTFRPISSLALGNGFHCGFLGLLHAEIVQERILREFGLTMIATSPSVEYRIKLKPGIDPKRLGLQKITCRQKENCNNITIQQYNNYILIQSAAEFPDQSLIEEIREPVMKVAIYSPKRYVGAVMQLCQDKRGHYIDMKYLYEESTIQQFNNLIMEEAKQKQQALRNSATYAMVELTYLIPLSEMIVDFFDRLKSLSEGYASLDYEFSKYQLVQLVKLDILLNHEKVDALSLLIQPSASVRRGRELVERLAEVIPRQQFAIPIQAAIGSPRCSSGEAGGKIIARADVKPFRKDVIQKLYGGDRTRKDKLLDAQKRGKERMKLIGRVQIPQSVFFEVLKRG